MTKYLSWRTDLALDSDSRKVWIRISGMLAEMWGEESDAKGDVEARFLDYERIPAFVYPVPADRLLPASNPEAHFASLEQRYE